MKFVSYNIQYSKGADGIFDLERIASVVKNADIIGLQEVVKNLPGVPDEDQPERLSQLLPNYFVAYGPALDFETDAKIVDGKACSRRLQFGNMILSRWPIVSTRNFVLPWSGLAHENDMQNCALEAVVDAPDGLMRVYSTHLNYRRSSMRREQMEWLVPNLFAITREGMGATGSGFGADLGGKWPGFTIPEMPERFIVLGDFNFTPECGEYDIAVGEDDFQFGRFVATDRWVDSWTQAGNNNENAGTWYDHKIDKWIKLDYGFVSPNLAAKVKTAWIDNDCPASDHQPYWFELDE